MNDIKHHNKFQSDMPSHIREMAKESYHFLLNADWERTRTPTRTPMHE